MLRHLQKPLRKYQFAIEKRLFVYDRYDWGNSIGNSGIRATIFGPSGFLGRPIAATLGNLGSDLIMPVSCENHYRHSEQVKELKLCGATNKSWLQWDMNFKNQQMIQNMIKNSNVVINLVGPRKKIKKREDFEFANIEIAERIAKACTKHGVHRLIHFSAAGAEPDSQSLDFQTKYQAEAVVKKAFPNVTIFRPCPVFGINDYFASIIQRQANYFFNHFVFVYDDCTTLKQPIRDNDIAKCVLNALKLEESKGKTYELGGPNILSMLELHEIIFNTLKFRQAKLAYIDPNYAMNLAKYIYNWEFFGQEFIRKRTVQEVVKSDRYLTVEDLRLQPVSFKNGIYDIMRQYIANYRDIDQANEN